MTRIVTAKRAINPNFFFRGMVAFQSINIGIASKQRSVTTSKTRQVWRKIGETAAWQDSEIH